MAKIRAYGLVRDANGVPQFDGDPNLSPPQVLVMLTPAERKTLGVWHGAFGDDARGTKRLTSVANGWRAEDACVALREIFDGADYYTVNERADYQVGAIIPQTAVTKG